MPRHVKLLPSQHVTSQHRTGSTEAYDQYLLGHGPTGLKELDKQIKRGAVKKSFRKKLLSVLHKYGYR